MADCFYHRLHSGHDQTHLISHFMLPPVAFHAARVAMRLTVPRNDAELQAVICKALLGVAPENTAYF